LNDLSQMSSASPLQALSASAQNVLLLNGPRRPVWHTTLVLVVGFLAVFAMVRKITTPYPGDLHARISLEMAVNRVLCGADFKLFGSRLSEVLASDQVARSIPIRTVVRQQSGSVANYCQSEGLIFVNNENSLMLLESLFLSLAPQQLSVDHLFSILLWTKIAALFVFAFILLESGASDLLGLACALLGAWTLKQLVPAWASIYSFVFTDILIVIAYYLFLLRYVSRERVWLWGLAAAVGGVLSAAATNMRTSHAPVYLGLFFLFVGAWLRGSTALRSRLAIRAGLLSVAFIVGYAAFQYVAIARRLPAEVKANYSYHAIAHPLVLALALPPNPLSRTEGIIWDDAAALKLARREDPAATYLGPTYETALFRYYVGLWRRQPRAMLGVYGRKFKIAGKDMVDRMTTGESRAPAPIAIVLWPLTWAPNGLWLDALCFAILVTAWRRYWRTGSLLAIAVGFMTSAALLLLLESGITYSYFTISYHAFLSFYAVFGLLFAANLAFTGAWNFVRRSPPRSFDRVNHEIEAVP
jgi:hypothetical protein